MILSPEARIPRDGARSREVVAEAWASCRRELRAALQDPAIHTVIVMVGVPGAGKSTWCAAQDGPGVVVFDAVWSHPGRRRAMATQIRTAGRKAVAVWVRTPVQVCLARQSARPLWRRVPQSVCLRAAAALHVQPPHVREGWTDVVVINGQGG